MPGTEGWCIDFKQIRYKHSTEGKCAPSRHLVIKDTGVRRTDIRLKAAVKHSNLTPIHVERLNVLVRDTGTEAGLLERDADRSHCWLRGQAGQV